MEKRFFGERKEDNVLVEELSSLTPIPEDQMVTVQEEVITTVEPSEVHPLVSKVEPVIMEEVMDEGTAPKREPEEEISKLGKKRKLTLKPKLAKSEGGVAKRGRPRVKKSSGTKPTKKKKDKGPRRVSAYLLFSRHTRPQITEEFPDLKMIDVNSKISVMWSEISESEKDYWRTMEIEENSKIGIETKPKKKKKKKRILPPPPTDGPPEALDLAAHLKLLGDSITKMGELTGEYYEQGEYSERSVSALLTNLLDCLLCVSAPLLYLSSHIDLIKVIPDENQIKMLDNIVYIMPGLENFKS